MIKLTIANAFDRKTPATTRPSTFVFYLRWVYTFGFGRFHDNQHRLAPTFGQMDFALSPETSLAIIHLKQVMRHLSQHTPLDLVFVDSGAPPHIKWDMRS